MIAKSDALAGCLIGAAVGDAIGLPYEGLSTRRARRFARLPLKHRFVLGRGMVSDDTDHSIFVAQALVRSGQDVSRFRTILAWRLKLWLLCLPAGIGLATLKGIVRLWLGFRNSGVHSAGNGPSMRSAIIGAAFPADATIRRRHVEASTLLTHTDPKALAGAHAIAEIAAQLVSGRWSQRPSTAELTTVLADISSDLTWLRAVTEIRRACESPDPLGVAQEKFGSRRGISGYVLHSVPFAVVAWYHCFGDYRATIEAVTQAGGDVDTVAAIAGALAGICVKPTGIPADWVEGLVDWPHSVTYLRSLAAGLADPALPTSTAFSPWLLLRGLVFTCLVLLHGFRRLLPPY